MTDIDEVIIAGELIDTQNTIDMEVVATNLNMDADRTNILPAAEVSPAVEASEAAQVSLASEVSQSVKETQTVKVSVAAEMSPAVASQAAKLFSSVDGSSNELSVDTTDADNENTDVDDETSSNQTQDDRSVA